MSWKSEGPGRYAKTEGVYDAFVILDGEIWRSYVYRNGDPIDQGEWDGRRLAMRNANSAINRAKALRSLELPSEDDGE